MGEAMTDRDKLHEWFLGDANAIKLGLDIIAVTQLADDFVDGDKDFDKSACMVKLLHIALVDIPINPFYAVSRQWITPLISSAILAWEQSNRLEQCKSDTELAFAFVYRDLLDLVIVQMALLLGGYEHARKVQQDIYTYVHTPKEQSFAEWKLERGTI